MGRLLYRRQRQPAPSRLARGRVHTPQQVRALRASGSLTAAGVRLDLSGRDTARRLVEGVRQPWQADAMRYRVQVGELRYATRYQGNAARKTILLPAVYVPGEGSPIPIDDSDDARYADVAHEALDRLGDVGARGTLARRTMENFKTAGEAYAVGRTDGGTGGEVWEVRSVSEVGVREGRPFIRETPGARDGIPLGDGDFLARLWVPDLEYQLLADSPVRVAIETCLEELVLLGKDVRASATSRLALNGILAIPDTLTILRADGAEGADSAEDDLFLAQLVEAASEAIRDPGSAAAALPLVLRGQPDAIDAIKQIVLTRPEADNSAKRAEAIGRLCATLDLPPEVVQGLAQGNHWCVDSETEILTANGWITQDRLSVGDLVLTLNHETGLSEWQPVDDIYRAEVADLPMLRQSNRLHDSLTTMDHRWPVVDRHTGKRVVARSFELTEKHNIVTAARCAELPTEPKWSDDLVELVAWFWTEGSVEVSPTSRRQRVTMSQSPAVNPDHEARIRGCLTRLFGPASTLLADAHVDRGCSEEGCVRSHYGRDLCRPHWKRQWRAGTLPSTDIRSRPRLADPAWRERTQLGNGKVRRLITCFDLNAEASEALVDIAPDKVVRLDWIRELTASQLELFIQVSMWADGQHRAGRDLTQRDPRRIDALELAAVLTGRTVVRSSYTEGAGFRAGRPVEQHRIGFWRQAFAAPVRSGNAVAERYTGTVWCPVTANTTWLARRNGKVYYTGNSAWEISRSTWQDHIEPDIQDIVEAWTVAYYRPYLLEAGVPEDVVARSVIWYDPVNVVTKPDKTAAAGEAHERAEISGTAYREHLGFRDDEAPDDTELLRRAALKGLLDPAATLAILQGKPPPEPAPLAEPVAPRAIETEPVDAEPVDGPPNGGVPPDAPEPAPLPDAAAMRRRLETALRRRHAIAPALVAAGPVSADEAVAISQRLAAWDAQLRDRVRGACEAAVRDALRRAGNRLVSKARSSRDPVVAAAVADVPVWSVPSRLGPAVTAALGLDEVSLLDVVLAELEALWHRYVEAGSSQALRQAARLVGMDVNEAFGVLDGRFRADRAAGWVFLRDRLSEVAAAALVDDPAEALAAGRLVSPSAARAALAVAGGFDVPTSRGIDRETLLPVDRREHFGGVGTGTTLKGFMEERGAKIERYQWIHGFSENAFEPHLELDRKYFDAWDDDVLAVDGFPAEKGTSGHLRPGDHPGCSCDMVLVWVPPPVRQGGTTS